MAARAKIEQIDAGAALPSAAQLLIWIDQMARVTGDRRWSHAAGIIRGKKPGRRLIDDRAALVEMEFLIETGEAQTPEEASRLVVPTIPQLHRHSTESATTRLARKFRRKMKQACEGEGG